MASETSSSAERVFCSHVLKPVPDEPGAYRFDRCGQIGDIRHRQIVWRLRHPEPLRAIVSRVPAREAKVSVEMVLWLTAGALACITVLTLALRADAGPLDMQPAAVAAELEPIPADEAAEHDSPCCGGPEDDPELAPGCRGVVDGLPCMSRGPGNPAVWPNPNDVADTRFRNHCFDRGDIRCWSENPRRFRCRCAHPDALPVTINPQTGQPYLAIWSCRCRAFPGTQDFAFDATVEAVIKIARWIFN